MRRQLQSFTVNGHETCNNRHSFTRARNRINYLFYGKKENEEENANERIRAGDAGGGEREDRIEWSTER